jgi:hypothetical protein
MTVHTEPKGAKQNTVKEKREIRGTCDSNVLRPQLTQGNPWVCVYGTWICSASASSCHTGRTASDKKGLLK